MIAGLKHRLFDIAHAFRFSLVGIAATLTYLAVVNLTARPLGPLTPFEGHLAGLACSIGVSYGGHHKLTFRRVGRHAYYFRRFAAITAALVLLTSVFAFVCDHYLRLPAAAISVMVALLYPALSYLLHSLWTFEERRRVQAP
jgi:putative flippase GtrA